MNDLEGRIGERFEILAEFPAGATGTVWLVRAREEGTERAVKILRPELSSARGAVGELTARLESVRQLAHPNILIVEDTVRYSDRVAMVMRRISGEDLGALVDRHYALTPAFATHLMSGVCDALAAAHAADIVHGDVKPSNVLLETDPLTDAPLRAVLTDFGIAALSARGGTLAQPPEYRAPEVGPGQPPIAASDVYAVGILLYEAITGRPPFTAAQPEEITRRHREAKPAHILSLPEPLWELIAACLAKRPQERPAAASVAERLRELAPLLETLPPLDEERAPSVPVPTVGPATHPAPAPMVWRIGPSRPVPPRGAAFSHRRRAAHGARDLALAVFGGVAVFAVTFALAHVLSRPPAVTANAASSLPNLALAIPSGSPQPTMTPSPSASVTHSPSPSASKPAPATSAAPTRSAGGGTTASRTPTAVPTTTTTMPPTWPPTSAPGSGSGPVTVDWQCATDYVRSIGLSKTACIGIGSDRQLYVQATFRISYGQNISDLSLSVFDGYGYSDISSEYCYSWTCSMTAGPFSAPAGSYAASAGVDDHAHNENSPSIFFPGS
ncbi:MAG TPA: protein kinase [Actinospica sp.]|nr:protein kinase [Actinospica sp.]